MELPNGWRSALGCSVDDVQVLLTEISVRHARIPPDLRVRGQCDKLPLEHLPGSDDALRGGLVKSLFAKSSFAIGDTAGFHIGNLKTAPWYPNWLCGEHPVIAAHGLPVYPFCPGLDGLLLPRAGKLRHADMRHVRFDRVFQTDERESRYIVIKLFDHLEDRCGLKKWRVIEAAAPSMVPFYRITLVLASINRFGDACREQTSRPPRIK